MTHKLATPPARPLRTSPLLWPVVAVLVGLLAAVVGPAPRPAVADEGASAPSTATFTNGRHSNTSSTLASEYARSRADRQRGQSVKADFIRRSAQENGIYYDDGFVDYLRLDRTDNAMFKTVELAAPRSFKATEVTLTEQTETNKEGKTRRGVTASSRGEVAATTSTPVFPSGPGFASWQAKGSGSYLLKTQVGEMLALWYMEKMTDDLDPNYDYWSYQRKGVARPFDITGPDYSVDYVQMDGNPAENTQELIDHWVDWKPAMGKFTGDCDKLPIDLTLSYLGASTSISFKDCDKYNAVMFLDPPGTYHMELNTALVKDDQPREMAFNLIEASLQNPWVFVYREFQAVRFWSNFYEGGVYCGDWVSRDCTVDG